ncbi:hypothetical protein AAMO2058_000383300 [Amorphochlora amoebiformis]
MGDAPMRKQVVKRGQQRNTGKTRRSRRAKRRADKKERFRRYNNPSQDRRDRDSAAKAPPPVRFGPRKSPFDEFQENPSAFALPQGYVSYAKGCDVILDHKNGVLIREVPAPNNSKFDDYPSSGLNKHRSPAERRVRFDPLMSPLEAKQNRKGRRNFSGRGKHGSRCECKSQRRIPEWVLNPPEKQRTPQLGGISRKDWH